MKPIYALLAVLFIFPGIVFGKINATCLSNYSEGDRLLLMNTASLDHLRDKGINLMSFEPYDSGLLYTKADSSKSVFRTRNRYVRAAIIPSALAIAGTLTLLPSSTSALSKYSIHDKILATFPNSGSSIDNYLQFAPIGLMFGLKAAGMQSRSDWVNQLVITAKAELLMNLIVESMKHTITSARPSGALHSMPSGHTAQAFVSATLLYMEYRDVTPWISVAGYVMAATTGMYRMINDKHWISDVLIGAGIGIFSTKVVYFTHQYRWSKSSKLTVLPAIYPKGGGVAMALIL